MAVINPRSAGVYGYETTPASAPEAFAPAKMGIIGWTEKGETDKAVLVRSVEEFRRFFGEVNATGNVALSVQAFFETGGQAAWVVRTAPSDAVSATINVDTPAKWTFTAKGGGIWGNSIKVRIVGNENFLNQSTKAYERFDVQILAPADFNASFDEAKEVYEAVQFTSATSADYILDAFADDRTLSRFVSLTAGVGGDPAAFTKLDVAGEAVGAVGATDYTGTAASVPVMPNTFVITAEKAAVANENIGIGDGATKKDLSTLTAISDAPVKPGSLNLTYNAAGAVKTITDDGAGNLAGDVDAGGTINYALGTMTGLSSVVANNAAGDQFEADYIPQMLASDDGLGNLTGQVDTAGTNTINYDTGAYSVKFESTTATVPVTAAYTKLTKEITLTLAGGADGTAVGRANVSQSTLEATGQGVYAFDLVDEPLNLTVPDFEGSSLVQTDLVNFAEARAAQPDKSDRFLILGAANASTPAAAIKYVLITQAYNTRVAGFYYPNVRFVDEKLDRVVTLSAGPFVAGIMSRTAENKNVGKAPAGVIDGALDGARIVGLERKLTRSEMDDLYSAKINPLIDSTATGRVVWGARSLSTDLRWRYVNARLLHNFLRHRIRFLLQFAVFENNGPSLWLRVAQILKGDLDSLFRQGYFAGETAADAFQVQCDARNNSAASSTLNVKVAFAPNTPAEFIVFTLEQPTSSA